MADISLPLGTGGARPPDPITVPYAKRIDDDRILTHVLIGEVTVCAVWVIGIKAGAPKVSWPRSGRGYPLIKLNDNVRIEAETAVLKHVYAEGLVA